jgi:hypothetical protein
MTAAKKIGIWMDHSSAHLMEFTTESIHKTTIESKFTHQERVHSYSRNENMMHNKEQHLQAEYYKHIGNVIRGYDEVLLFGPTDAKLELLNLLRADHRFEKIKLEAKDAGKMTGNQQNAFVNDHFQ